MQFHDLNHFTDDHDDDANPLEEFKTSQDDADGSGDSFEVQLLTEEQLQSALRIFDNGSRPLKSLFATTECEQFKSKSVNNIFEGS